MNFAHTRMSAIAVAAAAMALTAVAITAPGTAGAAGSTTVQVPERVCSDAGPGYRSCYAVRLVTKNVTSTQARQLRAEGLARPAGLAALSFGPAGGYTPTQVAKGYGLNTGATTTQTVAIVDAYKDPSVLADLNHFDSQYGLPPETATSFRFVNQTGGSDLNAVPSDLGWAGEITLDVQAVRGLCHKCKILLIEATSSSNANLGAAVSEAVTLGAKIVSNSYGGPESVGSDSNYNHPGVAILASTGDDGWYGWDVLNVGGSSSDAPNVPASYNTVIGVGGTSLYLNSDGTRQSEAVWNDNGSSDIDGYAIGHTFGVRAGATGGGCSTVSTARPWQQNVAGYRGLGCGATLRSGVDVAAVADSFTGYDTYETTSWCLGSDGTGHACPASEPGWETFGGTSLASPVVGAMWALAGGPAKVSYPALSLYGHFKSDTAHPLYDVTFGGNGACDTGTPGACGSFFRATNPNTAGSGMIDCLWPATGTATLANHYQCYARTGYDGVSGVGAPKNVNVFKPMSPKAAIQPPGTVTHGVAHTYSAAGSSSPFPGGSITSYTWNWGDGHTTTTTSATAKHTYAAKGSRTITLTVKDTYTAQNNARTGTKSISITVK
jgi:subtilase family serine protease